MLRVRVASELLLLQRRRMVVVARWAAIGHCISASGICVASRATSIVWSSLRSFQSEMRSVWRARVVKRHVHRLRWRRGKRLLVVCLTGNVGRLSARTGKRWRRVRCNFVSIRFKDRRSWCILTFATWRRSGRGGSCSGLGRTGVRHLQQIGDGRKRAPRLRLFHRRRRRRSGSRICVVSSRCVLIEVWAVGYERSHFLVRRGLVERRRSAVESLLAMRAGGWCGTELKDPK